MSTYKPEELLSLWQRGSLDPKMAIGHMLFLPYLSHGIKLKHIFLDAPYTGQGDLNCLGICCQPIIHYSQRNWRKDYLIAAIVFNDTIPTQYVTEHFT